MNTNDYERGKYLVAIAQADTIVFDKTGTLTKAQPAVINVVSFNGDSPDELLRMAACMEEHFPHSMAKAVVNAARERNLEHEEMHSRVDYIVAHGISTFIGDKKTIIGSHHFVFEDEGCELPEGMMEKFHKLPGEQSHLYLAIDNKLAGVICIEDPLREEAEGIINSLRKAGISKIVMMTGDNKRAAASIAKKVGVDEYYSEVLPEDKAKYVEKEKAEGKKVIMVGDGINDSPALSAADEGIAISDSLMKRIGTNYRFIVGFKLRIDRSGSRRHPAARNLCAAAQHLHSGCKRKEHGKFTGINYSALANCLPYSTHEVIPSSSGTQSRRRPSLTTSKPPSPRNFVNCFTDSPLQP